MHEYAGLTQQIQILTRDKLLQTDIMNNMEARLLNKKTETANELRVVREELAICKAKLDSVHRETMHALQQYDGKIKQLEEEKTTLLQRVLPDKDMEETSKKLQKAINEIRDRSFERRDTKIKMEKLMDENIQYAILQTQPVKREEGLVDSAILIYEKNTAASFAFLLRSMERYYEDNLEKYNIIQTAYLDERVHYWNVGMYNTPQPIEVYPLEYNLSIQLKTRFNDLIDLVARTNILQERRDIYNLMEKLVYGDFDTIKYNIYVRHKKKNVLSKVEFEKNPYGFYNLSFSHELSTFEMRVPSIVRRILSFRSSFDENGHKINKVRDNIKINNFV